MSSNVALRKQPVRSEFLDGAGNIEHPSWFAYPHGRLTDSLHSSDIRLAVTILHYLISQMRIKASKPKRGAQGWAESHP